MDIKFIAVVRVMFREFSFFRCQCEEFALPSGPTTRYVTFLIQICHGGLVVGCLCHVAIGTAILKSPHVLELHPKYEASLGCSFHGFYTV